MTDQELQIKKLTSENAWLKKKYDNLSKEKSELLEEYLNYMEYSELTILDLAVELNKLKGIDNTMSPSEFKEFFEKNKLNHIEYYSS